jgi:hypothetical protein
MPIVATAMHPSDLTWLGASHEAGQGNPAFTATLGPVWTYPLDASTFDPEDKPVWLRDIAIRGSAAEVFAIAQGVEDSAWSLAGPVYPGLTNILLDNMFGDVTTTATGGTAGTPTTSSAVYTRNTSGLNITLTTAAGFTAAGQIGKITSGTQTEFFIFESAASNVITIQAPLHFTYPSGSTVTPYTVAPTSYSMKYATLNAYDAQPPSWTLLDATGIIDSNQDLYGQRFYTTMCLAQLDFTISAEQLFTAKASGTAWASQPTSAAPVSATAAYSPTAVTTVPVPSWSSQIQLSLPNTSGLVVRNDVGEVTFSLKRKLQVYWTDDGVQTPFAIARGPLGVTGTVKNVVAQDEQILASMLKNFQGALSAQVTVPSTTPYSAGEQGQTYLFSMNNCAFEAAKPNRSQVLVGYDATFEGVANTTNVGATGGLGPITVTTAGLQTAQF